MVRQHLQNWACLSHNLQSTKRVILTMMKPRNRLHRWYAPITLKGRARWCAGWWPSFNDAQCETACRRLALTPNRLIPGDWVVPDTCRKQKIPTKSTVATLSFKLAVWCDFSRGFRASNYKGASIRIACGESDKGQFKFVLTKEITCDNLKGSIRLKRAGYSSRLLMKSFGLTQYRA